MKTEETFPLPWEQVFWSSSPAFPASLLSTTNAIRLHGFSSASSDVKIVPSHELALDDIESVRLTQSWWQRASGTSTVQSFPDATARVLELANIHHGPQLALILQLRATELFGDDSRNLDAEFFRSALGPDAPSILRPIRGSRSPPP